MNEKLYQNKEWLYDEYIVKKLSSHKIAKLFDTDHKVITHWLKKFNIEIRKNGLKNKNNIKFKNKKWLEEQYFNLKLSTRIIARNINVSQKTIINWLILFNIERRESAEAAIGTQPTKENHHNWNGGITPLRKQIRESSNYKKWRKSIFIRDEYKCVICNSNGVLNVDHINPFSIILYENNIKIFEDALLCEELWDIKNGRTLCVKCHKETDTYGHKTNKILKAKNEN